ncbi:MAG: cysteine--tRNA ligase [Patescibacteria group bacterium UBA2163]
MPFFKKKDSTPPITLFNTRSKEKETFKSITAGKVKMYTCGSTVYDYAHIGNLRAAIFPDIIRRVFEYAGYEVKSVLNITDFGHLADETDDLSEDKMSLAVKREGRELTMENMLSVAGEFMHAYQDDLRELNVKNFHAMPRASEHVRGMVAYIEELLHKDFAYTTSDGIYFDTAKFPHYGCLGGSSSTEHSRVGVLKEKHNPEDFALWKFNDSFGWDAPWGKGFPGWHIECVAMSTQYLGKTFDIHAGGIDLIPIHHNNEIAEAEAANNKPYAHYWMHNEFITIGGQKISKSLGNTITLKQLVDRGISPLAFRYWLLTGHYRQKMNFTWDAIEAAQTALTRAWRTFTELKGDGEPDTDFIQKFEDSLYDDFNTAEAVAVLWETLKDSTIADGVKKATILKMDTVLGVGFGRAALRLEKTKVAVLEGDEIPEKVQELIDEREAARNMKDFAKADNLREEIKKAGFEVHDSSNGPVINRI